MTKTHRNKHSSLAKTKKCPIGLKSFMAKFEKRLAFFNDCMACNLIDFVFQSAVIG